MSIVLCEYTYGIRYRVSHVGVPIRPLLYTRTHEIAHPSLSSSLRPSRLSPDASPLRRHRTPRMRLGGKEHAERGHGGCVRLRRREDPFAL